MNPSFLPSFDPDSGSEVHSKILKATIDDYETVLHPIFEEKLSSIGDINYLLVLETNVSHFTAEAWWRDFKLMLKYYKRWNKIAVVTDQRGVEWFSDVFKFIIPCESKGFPLDRLDEAIIWISERAEI